MNPAEAALLFTLTEVGNDVVLEGSGTVNLTDLTLNFSGATGRFINPSTSSLTVGSSQGRFYSGFVSQPTSFGTGSNTFADSNTGDAIMIATGFGADNLGVPSDYISGESLNGTSTFNNTDLVTLGATPGTYTWTWGSGANADSATLEIGSTAAVPEPMTILGTLTALGFGTAFKRRQAKG